MESKLLDTVEQTINTAQTFAIGNDLVYLSNFETSFTPGFKNKVYTPAEISYCSLFTDSLLRYASTWAAKEAVYKAVKQLDATPLGWKKIEISRDKIGGRPHVTVHGHPAGFKISLSISHDGEYVWAVAFVELQP